MKTALLPLVALVTLPAFSEPRYVTLKVPKDWSVTDMGTRRFELLEGQTAEVLAMPSATVLVTWPDNPNGTSGYHTLPIVLSGPAKIEAAPLNLQPSYSHNAFVTLRIFPDLEAPHRTLTLAPTTNAVTVHLESSTNLLDWSKSASVTLTNVPTATFYRARVE